MKLICIILGVLPISYTKASIAKSYDEPVQCVWPVTEVLYSDINDKARIQSIISIAQKSLLANIGDFTLTATSLATELAEEFNATWHAVVTKKADYQQSLVWSVAGALDLLAFEIGYVVVLVFQRNRQSAVQVPTDEFQNSVETLIKQIPNDKRGDPTALQLVGQFLSQRFQGQWQIIAGPSVNIDFFVTAQYISDVIRDRGVTYIVYSIDIPDSQILVYKVQLISPEQTKDDLVQMHTMLNNHTDPAPDLIADYFQSKYTGLWTAVTNADAWFYAQNTTGFQAELYDTTTVAAVQQNIPEQFVTKGNQEYLADYIGTIINNTQSNTGDLPQAIVNQLIKKFGGRWASACGARDALLLSNSATPRSYETTEYLPDGRKCIIWLVGTDPPLDLQSPTTNMYAAMADQCKTFIREGLLSYAGDLSSIALYVINNMATDYSTAGWQIAISDGAPMTASADLGPLNFMWINTPEWSVAVVQTDLLETATSLHLEQQAFFDNEIQKAVKAIQDKTANFTRPDDAIRQALELKYGSKFMVLSTLGNLTQITLTPNIQDLLLKSQIVLDGIQQTLYAVELKLSVVIKDNLFVDQSKVEQVRSVLQKPETPDSLWAQHVLDNIILNFDGDWNVFLGDADASAYAFWFDAPNWIVARVGTKQSVVFKRTIQSQFNTSTEAANEGLSQMLQQVSLQIDPSKSTFGEVATYAQRFIVESTQTFWNVAVGRNGTYSIVGNNQKFVVQYIDSNDIAYTVWLA